MEYKPAIYYSGYECKAVWDKQSHKIVWLPAEWTSKKNHRVI